MGASDFIDYGIGKTADEAFSNAVQQARYDYGHAGYTGTIAEKPGFVLFTLPKYTTAEKVVASLWGAKLALDAEAGVENYYRPDRKQMTKAKADLKWLRARFTDRQIRDMWEAHDNKWDDCLAFELKGKERLAHLPKSYDAESGTWITRRTTKKVFMFAGFASS